MANFPNVKYLDAATFAESLENPSIEPGKMEGGYVLTRPRHTRRPRRTFSFQFVNMDDANKALLQEFYNSMRGSSNAFNWTNPHTGSLINVRFDNSMTLKFSRSGYGSTNVWQTDTIVLTEV